MHRDYHCTRILGRRFLITSAFLLFASFFPFGSEAQTIIDTTKSHGTSFAGIVEGPGTTDGFGQTFVAPKKDTLLISFTFWLDDSLGNERKHHELKGPESYTDFGAYVMEWCPKTKKPIGEVLWESGQRTTTNNHGAGGMEKFTFDTGGVPLKPGSHYILFLSTADFLDGVPGAAKIATYWDPGIDFRNPYTSGYWVYHLNREFPNWNSWRSSDEGWDAAVRIVLIDPNEEPLTK